MRNKYNSYEAKKKTIKNTAYAVTLPAQEAEVSEGYNRQSGCQKIDKCPPVTNLPRPTPLN
jgi:hypothetical protein